MTPDVFHESEFVLLVLFSIVIPAGIYAFLFRKVSISRWTVGAFATVLLAVAGVNVVLLQHLSQLAKPTGTTIYDKLFSGQVSLALYVFPLVFGGVAVNLLSHMLVSHLDEAEAAFEDKQAAPRAMNAVPHLGARSPVFVL
ncbi:MAG TPA: hypothetical protein PLZ79_03480, partial [Burkholderiales bacterium]|nr:hypothetical protein [Burkholderiales bacterium]